MGYSKVVGDAPGGAKGMIMNINWTSVMGSVIAIVNALVALADFLQGGVAWPCLLIVIGLQAFAVARVRRSGA